MIGAGLSLLLAAVLQGSAAVAQVAPDSTFGSLHCVSYVNGNHRTLKLCAQVEELGGYVRTDVSVHCLNAAGAEYRCSWVVGGVVWLYKDGAALYPQSSFECGHDGYPGCNAPQAGYSLLDPDVGTHAYRARLTTTEVQTYDSNYVNVQVWSNPVNI